MHLGPRWALLIKQEGWILYVSNPHEQYFLITAGIEGNVLSCRLVSLWEPVTFVGGRNPCLPFIMAFRDYFAICTPYNHHQWIESIRVHLCSHYRQYLSFLMKHSIYNYLQRMK